MVTELELEEPFDLVIDVDGELGSVVYTTDGSDPRAVGGDPVGIDAGAGTTITIDDVGLVRARTLDGVDWSAVHELVVRLPEPDEEEEQEEEDSDPADSGAVPGPGDADCGCGSTEGSRAAWLLVLWAIGAASQRRLSPLN